SAASTYTFYFFVLLSPPPPLSTLFPYTTLFRSPWHFPANRGRRNVSLAQVRQELDVYVEPVSDYDQRFHVMLEKHFEVALEMLLDRKSTRLNSSHSQISYAVFCLKKKKKKKNNYDLYNPPTLYAMPNTTSLVLIPTHSANELHSRILASV